MTSTVSSDSPALTLTGVNKAFGGVQAVRDVNLSIDSAKITALIGPNGAGKTTLFNVISGFGTPYTGSITFGDVDLTGWAPHRVARAGVVRNLPDPDRFPDDDGGRQHRHRHRRAESVQTVESVPTLALGPAGPARGVVPGSGDVGGSGNRRTGRRSGL